MPQSLYSDTENSNAPALSGLLHVSKYYWINRKHLLSLKMFFKRGKHTRLCSQAKSPLVQMNASWKGTNNKNKTVQRWLTGKSICRSYTSLLHWKISGFSLNLLWTSFLNVVIKGHANRSDHAVSILYKDCLRKKIHQSELIFIILVP